MHGYFPAVTMGFVILFMLSSPAGAQSTIAGVVRDVTGAVLPGVTIEASSAALIEKTRVVVSDEGGLFRIADLRPGTYQLIFELQGFTSVKHTAIELQSGVTVTANAEMKVGGLEETLTVSGVGSTIDVQSAVQQVVMTREVMDAVPTGRSVFSVGALIPGTTSNRPDVGGTEGMQQTQIQVHGSETRDVSFQVDGMSINSNFGNAGVVGVYYNDGMMEEISYQTNALPAEVSQGGVRINMIPREGGNTLHGALFATAASGSMQSDNFSDDLRALGMTAPNSVDTIHDVNGSVGGRIVRDRLWFFSTFRHWGVDRFVANTFNPDRTQALDDNYIYSTVVRLTLQATPKNKISAYYDKNVKWRGHRRDLTADYQFVEPRASYLQTTPLGYTGQMKWVSTVSNNLLFETGVSAFFLHYKTGYQPEVGDSDMAKIDFVKSTLTNAVVRDYDSYAQRQTYTASMSYVTGAHNFKTGLQYGMGPYKETVTINGDRVLRFRDGVPDSVDVYNSPLEVKESLNVDVGIYAQDTWTVKRATINAGVRLEHFNTSIDAQASAAGTFVPARSFAEISDVPNWTDIVPRFGIAYDLFGDSRSAIKVSASKYMGSEGVGLAHTVNPMFTSLDRRSWSDANGNGEAELSEIGPSTGFRGGVNQRIDPEITRPYNWEYSASFQQQLPARLTMSVAYYKRNVRNLYGVKNQLVTPADYTALSITNPVTGDPLTIYNLDPAKANLVDLLVSNYGELDKDYNGVEIRADKRFNNSAMLFGGVTIGKKYGSIRGTSEDLNDPNRLINARGYVDLDSTVQTKIAGTYPLPLRITLSGSLQSGTGQPLRRVFNVTRALVPTLTQVSMPVDVVERGSVRAERLNQVDMRVGRVFQTGRTKFEAIADVYNLLNDDSPTAEVETVGSSLGRPSSILDGRLLRLGLKITF